MIASDRSTRGDHVSCVLLVARRVGDDELSLRRGEVSIGDVDRDPLLPFSFEPVGQKGEIDLVTGVTDRGGVGLERRKGVFVDHLRVVKQTTDERRLAVVDRPAGEKAEQVLALVFGEIGLDVGGDEFGLVRHD